MAGEGHGTSKVSILVFSSSLPRWLCWRKGLAGGVYDGNVECRSRATEKGLTYVELMLWGSDGIAPRSDGVACSAALCCAV